MARRTVNVDNQANRAENENDYRVNILNSFLTTPHGEMTATEKIHNEVLTKDPIFYGHLGAWYCNKGDVRDHQVAFIGNLLTSDRPDHRSAGYVLLQKLPPFMVEKTVRFVNDDLKRWSKKGLPRSGKKAVEKFLRSVESNTNRLDQATVRARQPLTYLYATNHIKPCDRAKRILFDNDPPRGSAPWAVKKIKSVADPTEQAKMIVKYDIPYPIASSIIKKITPTVLIALVNSMSPQELMNNMNSIKKFGAYENDEVKKIIKEKLSEGKTDKRVNVMKTRKAIEKSGEMIEELEDVGNTQVKSRDRIKRPTGLLIDASSSQHVSITVGKQVGNMVGAACEHDLFVYAFDTMPYPIVPKLKAGQTSPELSDWEKAMAGINPKGCTSIGAPLKLMIANNQYVEQFIVITDEGENERPYFYVIYEEYCKKFNVRPSVWIIRMKDSANRYCDHLEKQLKGIGVEVGVLKFEGDYNSLTNLLPLLSKPSIFDLLMEIMATPLPQREDLVLA